MRSELLVLLPLLTGCAWTNNQAATAEYTRQVMTASLRVAQLEASLIEAERQIAQLQEALRVQGQHEASRLENIDQVNAEVNRLRGRIEVLRFDLDELQGHVEDRGLDQERRQLHDEARLRQVEKFLGIEPPPPPTDEDLGITASDAPLGQDGEPVVDGAPSEDAEPAEPPEEMTLPEGAAGKLDFAVEHLQAGRAGVARVVLERALEAHPDAAEVAEIRYRIGETWFNERAWGNAITAFQAVIDNHPRSEWAAWALLRQGESFQAKGTPDDATLFFEEVLRLYPRSEAARDARRLLQQR